MNIKNFLYFFINWIFLHTNCFCQGQVNKSFLMETDTVIVCKITSIKSATIRKNMTNRAYIIVAQDTSTKKHYTLVSLKSNDSTLPKIKKNNIYTIGISKYFECDLMLDFDRFFIVELASYIIAIPSGHFMNIYITPNLRGLGFNSFKNE